MPHNRHLPTPARVLCALLVATVVRTVASWEVQVGVRGEASEGGHPSPTCVATVAFLSLELLGPVFSGALPSPSPTTSLPVLHRCAVAAQATACTLGA